MKTKLRLISIIAIALVATKFFTTSPTPTYADSPPEATAERPFQLPFAEPSSPETWMMAQPYGNTTGAYRQRFTTYGLSGGIHFGVDLSAPCGTEIVAIADGVVFAVDGPYGSPPHNLMIDHPEQGYASMYGHLLEKPDVKPGQQVKQGEVVALTGDSAELCYRRPHLHLEIRDLEYHTRKYNPHALIDANWDSLALIGSSGRSYARDLADPRKWQSLYDQPEVQTAGRIVNDFAETWPLDWSKRDTLETQAEVTTPETQTVEIDSLGSTSVAQQVTAGNCCTLSYWNSDSTQVRFVDQPAADQPLGFWGVDISSPGQPELVSDRLAVYTRDGSYRAYPDRDKGVAIVERVADGETWEIDTQERRINFTPDSQGLMWITYDEDTPRDNRAETIWLADIDGSNARDIFTGRRTSPIAWLSDDELLMGRRMGGSSDEELFILSISDNSQTELFQEADMRDLAFSPDKRYLAYLLRFNGDTSKNGIWLVDLQARTPTPEKLPFFGAYRWQDNDNLVYVPFDSEATEHNFYQYNVRTEKTQPLFPEGTGLTIANNDWDISPDGKKIALLAVKDAAQDGIWVLDIN